MAVKFIAKDDTLEDFRLAFNDQSANSFGDIANLSGSITSTNLVDAMNETISIAVNTAGFTLRDSTSTTQQIGGGNILNVVGAANEITAVVSATDTLTIGLPDDVTITGNLTASGSTHSLGTIQISGNTLSSTDSTTIIINDALTVNSPLVAGVTTINPAGSSNITSSTGFTVFDSTLVLAQNKSIAFEGSTSNDFETVLTVTDPTADRILTLPDETGTLITTAGAATRALSIALAAALG